MRPGAGRITFRRDAAPYAMPSLFLVFAARFRVNFRFTCWKKGFSASRIWVTAIKLTQFCWVSRGGATLQDTPKLATKNLKQCAELTATISELRRD